MRCFVFSLIVLFAMSSCNSPVKKDTSDGLSFYWYRAGRLPADSPGIASPGLAGPVAGVTGQWLIVGGGSNFPDGEPWNGGKKKYYDHIYLFKKEKDSLVCVNQYLRLPYTVGYSANCSTGKGIVVAGGENEKGAMNKVLLLTCANETNDLHIRFLPGLPLSLTNGMTTVIRNKIYFAGGENKQEVSDQFYSLDLNDTAAGWQPLPALPHPASNGVLLAEDSRIYLVGGRKRNIDSTSDLYDEVYCYDTDKKEWQEKASLPYALSAQTGVTWNDSTLLIFSGDKGKTFHATELLLMKIAREKDANKKEQLIAEKNELQKSHPGFNGDVLSYNTKENKWEKIDSVPFPGQVTTTAVKWDNEIIIPCGEIRAGVRTPDIIVGKIDQ